MENRLAFLLKELGYKESSRKIEKKTGVSFTTSFRLATNKDNYNCTFNNIVSLCTFFNVSIDFLMNKRNDGYYVYSEKGDRINLTYEDAIRYKNDITYEEIAIDESEEKSENLPKTYIRRVLRLNENTQITYVTSELEKRICQMNESQLKDILDLINKYIIK